MCHWTYRRGRLASPWAWPTREEVEQDLADRRADLRVVESPVIYQVHATGCACEQRTA